MLGKIWVVTGMQEVFRTRLETCGHGSMWKLTGLFVENYTDMPYLEMIRYCYRCWSWFRERPLLESLFGTLLAGRVWEWFGNAGTYFDIEWCMFGFFETTLVMCCMIVGSCLAPLRHGLMRTRNVCKEVERSCQFRDVLVCWKLLRYCCNSLKLVDTTTCTCVGMFDDVRILDANSPWAILDISKK